MSGHVLSLVGDGTRAGARLLLDGSPIVVPAQEVEWRRNGTRNELRVTFRHGDVRLTGESHVYTGWDGWTRFAGTAHEAEIARRSSKWWLVA